MGTVPELPEVAALALFLRERTVGRVVTGVDVAEISALKTFSPAPAELVGRRVTDVCRHGKWIDVVTAGAQDGEPIHLVVHLARAGWLRWHERVPDTPVRLTRSPLALRVRLLAERAALGLPEEGDAGPAPGQLLYPEQVFVWIKDLVDAADEQRRLGQDLPDLDTVDWELQTS